MRLAFPVALRTRLRVSRLVPEPCKKGPFARLTKSDMVKLMERHFTQAAEAANPNGGQQCATAWLPEAMQFPAIESADAKADSYSDEAE